MRGRRAAASLVLVVVLGCGSEPPTSPGERAVAPVHGSSSKASPPIRWLAHPQVLATGAPLGAIAVTPRHMLATTVGPAPAKLVRVDTRGNLQPFFPEFVASPDIVCHLALSPGRREGFPDDDVFVSSGADLWRLRAADGAAQVVATLQASQGDIAGLCFDTTGDFRNDLLVLTATGSVLRLGPDFVSVELGSFGAGARGPSVLSTRKGARLVVALTAAGRVRAMDAKGAVADVGGWSGVSAALAFPQRTSAHAGTGAALFVATANAQILMFPLADVASRAGSLLLTSMHASGSGLATPKGTYYQLDAWSRHRGPEMAAAFVQLPSVLKIDVDVAPSLNGGPLTLHDPTPVRVALLGAPWFEAGWVEVASVRFAGAVPVDSRRASFSLEDVNGDTYVDLVLSFRASEMSLELTTTSVTLTGQTLAGDALQAEVAVRVSDGTLDGQRLRSRGERPVGTP